MNETQLLNQALDLLKNESPLIAYAFLIDHLDKLGEVSSQVYNFLYCLGSVNNRTEEALSWLEAAIVDKEMWYRPEVFEDEDLDAIRMDSRFQNCYNISYERYLKMSQSAQTECTWREKTKDGIALILHGNQQNNHIAQGSWSFLENIQYQVAYLQSKEVDSYGLFRWEDKGSGSEQVKETLSKIQWENYTTKVMGGFSAGCNALLSSLKDFHNSCDYLILQSPWIPMINEDLESVVHALKTLGTKVLMICGAMDEDCLPLCKLLETRGKEVGINIVLTIINGLGHDYPEDFETYVNAFLS